MPQEIINGVGKAGIRVSTGPVVSYDMDAQAFLTAAGITATTEVNAVNELVKDLKSANIWTKMKAVYPMVGGTATTHKFNLKDPRDLDAAYRLAFFGGWTHTSTGALPNGTDAYANTFLSTSTIGLNSGHLSFYSRTNNTNLGIDIGSYLGSPTTNSYLRLYVSGAIRNYAYCGSSTANVSGVVSTLGFYSVSRTAASVMKGYRNGSIEINSTVNSNATSSLTFYLGANNNGGSPGGRSNRENAFASIGDGLTDLESNLFYQIVEKYQYALGRNVNANQTFYFNRNYSNETNAFIFNGAISDATQQSAINTLVNDLKAAGIWTKMKAVYPMVGGTATAHKFNLVNPIDSTSAYALTFNGGWTHTSNGATPNGTTGYANTNLVPNTADLGFNFNMNISFYSRTNRPSLVGPISDMGCLDVQGTYKSALIQFMNTYDLQTDGTNLILSTDTNTLGMIMASRTANNSLKAYRNGGLVGNNTATISNGLPAINYYLGAFLYRNASGGFANYYGTKECAFASIGNGLTDAEATTFYNAVQAFQTTLGRQV